jgi:3-isopropylmalate dehydrogenase
VGFSPPRESGLTPVTRAGTERVSRFAFQLAARRKARGQKSRVTCVDKANVFASLAFFRKVFEEIGAQNPAIERTAPMSTPWH